MTHGENLRVLIFEENASEAESLANLLRESVHSLQTDFVEEAGGLALLWQYGMEYIQGNFIQQPDRQPDDDFAGETA